MAPKRRSVKSKKKSKQKEVDYITEAEFTKLLKGARLGRHPERDVAMIYLTFQHGFRATELVTLRKTALKLPDARIKVKRLKGSLSTEHPLSGACLRALRAYLRTRSDNKPRVFISERGALH